MIYTCLRPLLFLGKVFNIGVYRDARQELFSQWDEHLKGFKL